jgi:hypothetical protein
LKRASNALSPSIVATPAAPPINVAGRCLLTQEYPGRGSREHDACREMLEARH